MIFIIYHHHYLKMEPYVSPVSFFVPDKQSLLNVYFFWEPVELLEHYV